MSRLTISRVEQKDIDRLSDIYFAAYTLRDAEKELPSEEHRAHDKILLMREWRRDDYTTLKVENAEKKILGFLNYRHEGVTINVVRFCTLPDTAKPGSALMRHFLQEACDKCAAVVRITPSDEESKSIYEHYGFATVGPGTRMEKLLTPASMP